MASSLSIRYPPANEGFWSPVTATLDWCEENYYATFYIAEIVNTLTNVFFIHLAVSGIRNSRRNKHPVAMQVAFFNMLFIGVGSFLFHMTLSYWMQLLDELSMVYLTSTNFYATFAFKQGPVIRALVLAFTISFSVGGTLYYHYLKDPVFHQNAFAILTATVILTNVYKMENLLGPVPAQEEAIKAKQAATLRTMRALVLCGVGAVAFAFTIWSLDNVLCSYLQSWRRSIGLPWGILLEGHGWWHIFTAVSTRYILVWLTWLRYFQEGRQDEVFLEWPSYYTSLPLVHRKSAKLRAA